MTSLPSAAGGHIKDATDQTFMADVVEASKTQPVLVDFWAPWCGPCRSLTPVIEKVVNGLGGKIKLVKVNIDENPGYAGQMGVRSIPAVFAFDKGRPVNGFQGALPESQIRQFVDQILGGTDNAKQIAEVVERAGLALQQGEVADAADMYAAVLEVEPQHLGAIAGLARAYLANGDPERAGQILDMAPADKQSDPAIKSVRTALSLMADTPLDDELATLRETVAAQPDNHDARYDLAEKLIGAGKLKSASDHLLILLGTDLNWGEGKAKAKLLEIFEASGPKDPVTIEGRRRLGSLIFS